MKIRLILTLIIVMVSMILVACNTPGQKAWVEVSCDEFNDNHHIVQMLEIHIGETFEVKLCSNPSTGFRWSEEAQISDQTILQQEDHEFIGPESEPPPPPGTPGQEVWSFKALKQGSSDIYLEYSQPWEGGEKGEWTCKVHVIVKESPVTSDYWEVTVSYPIVSPQDTVYDVVVTNHKDGWHWQGEIRLWSAEVLSAREAVWVAERNLEAIPTQAVVRGSNHFFILSPSLLPDRP